MDVTIFEKNLGLVKEPEGWALLCRSVLVPLVRWRRLAQAPGGAAPAA